jgi:hypothetical protein
MASDLPLMDDSGLSAATRWASGPLDGDVNEAFSALERGMPVALIATFQLLDKTLAARRLGLFNGVENADAMLASVNNLRNSITHGHQFAQTRATAEAVPKSVRTLRTLIGVVQAALRARAEENGQVGIGSRELRTARS